MRLTLILLAGLALAACNNAPEAPPADNTAPPAPPPVLAGVDLTQPVRAIGTEPFWAVDITPQTLIYSAPDDPGVSAPNPGPTIQGTTAVYATTSNGTALVVTLIATECSDGMSDRVYPLTARVERGSQTLNGCAASVAFLESQPQP
ncbi:hypothetical protein [Brevundimonas sp. NIBR11]|uniref:COG3650 family protein n=1 Tax=Brevundimonas sp. NIBR11 TaxID=3015999 RepID=UPI0022EFE86F|nr:hypothetical protein [Brevundimonas sp. NIBR11]WGM32913.1 hypothetical protein KKHFBJBL_03169 [Brevundimonas sp. NIBR11]